MNHKTPEWMERGCVLFDRITANGLTPWPSQREAFISGYGEGAIPANNRAVALEAELESLRNPSDGRCMEIGALRERTKSLEAQNLALVLEVENLINIMQRCFDIARGASYVKGGVLDIQSLLDGALSTPFSSYQRGAELYRKLREAALGTYRVGPTALNKALAELDKWEAGK